MERKESQAQAEGLAGLETSELLTTEFLQKVLEELDGRDGGGVLRITNFHVENAVGKGENYSSQMLRIRLDVADGAVDGEGIIAFEDLRDQGFKMATRQTGMDLAHCLLLMRSLGQFHALSIFLHEDEPETVNYKGPFFTESVLEAFEACFPNKLDKLAARVEGWPAFRHFANKLRTFGKTAVADITALFNASEEKVKVLNHGDCWVNNTMYKYSQNGEPVDIRFVDFQMCFHTSMAWDLLYFIFSSPRPDIRTKKMGEMLLAYHTTYLQVLKELGFQHRALTWDELQEEVKRLLPFGLLTSCSTLPIAMAEPNEAIELEDVAEDDIRKGDVAVFAKMFNSNKYNDALRLLLPYFEEQGIL